MFDTVGEALECAAGAAAFYGEPMHLSNDVARHIGGWTMLRGDGQMVRAVGVRPVVVAPEPGRPYLAPSDTGRASE